MNIITLLAGLDGSLGSSIQTFHSNPFFSPVHSCCIVAKVGRNLFEKEIFFFFFFYIFLHVKDIFKRSALSELCLCPPRVQSSQGGGHRTLLYGHAILLRHNHSAMVRQLVRFILMSDGRSCPKENLCPQYLSCLTTSRSLTDKLAFDVGLQEDSTGNPEYSQRFQMKL